MKSESKVGFFKATQSKEDPNKVELSAKDPWVLPRLRAMNGDLGEIVEVKQSSSPFKLTTDKKTYAGLMYQLAMDIDYTSHSKMTYDTTPPEALEAAKKQMEEMMAAVKSKLGAVFGDPGDNDGFDPSGGLKN